MSARPVAAASKIGGRPQQEPALAVSPDGLGSVCCCKDSRDKGICSACREPCRWDAVLKSDGEEAVLGKSIWWLRRGDTRPADMNRGVCSAWGRADSPGNPGELTAVPGPGTDWEAPPGVLCLPPPPPPFAASSPEGPPEEGLLKATPPSISEVAARFLRVRGGLPAHAGASGGEQPAGGDTLAAVLVVAAGLGADVPSPGARGLAAVRITLTVLRARCALNVPLKEDGSDRGVWLLGKVPAQLSSASTSLDSPESEGLPLHEPEP